MSKVPEVTVYFWIAKVLTTGMGETTSDFLVKTYDPVIVVALAGLVLAGVLGLQFFVSRYQPWVYWAAVVMVSVFGTMCADVLHVQFGVPYVVSSGGFAVVLAVIFLLWYRSEGTLSIHSIHTPRREAFYWATIIATFALGTATGDMTATTLHLGYFTSGVVFAVLFALPGLAHWKLGLNAIFAFWCAYIITRPFGASFADWMGVSHARGGLNWGTGPVSLVLLVLIIGCVGFLAVTRKDVTSAATGDVAAAEA
ncbi:hypothetical protein [Streptacidiphilus sp. EB129]|uniref:COG4705 family protein n=1 Tax=Streptacidiphilus sp. EB129 TaxID=3156262 RepID=UPI0035189325